MTAQNDVLTTVKQILSDIDVQMVGTLSGANFDAEVAKIWSVVVSEMNELGETCVTAAKEGW